MSKKSCISCSDKRSFSACSLSLLKKGSLRKLFKPNPFEGLLERLKDGTLSNVIERERSHLESTPIFSPSMPTLHIKFESISKPIIDPYDSYPLSPETHDDPRNLPKNPNNRIYQDHEEDRAEEHQWLESIKNQCAIVIEWMDEALYETNSRGNSRKIFDIYDQSPLEVENDGDFNE
jgi:hypothetical protein